MKHLKLLQTLGLSLALVTASVAANAQDGSTMTGQEKIDALLVSIGDINARIELNGYNTVGAVGYATIGGVIEDDAMSEGLITEQELNSYLQAKDLVLEHDYAVAQTAEQLFTQEYAGAMVNLNLAVDTLTDATSVIMSAVAVAEVASVADTKPEQAALQDMLSTDEFSITGEEVAQYNDAVVAVEGYAQQAGAFMAAANNTELTSSIDSYAAQGNFVVGSYTAITYTQSVDEFVITWADAGFGTGWSGYLSNDMKSAGEIYAAGEYIETYGAYPTQ